MAEPGGDHQRSPCCEDPALDDRAGAWCRTICVPVQPDRTHTQPRSMTLSRESNGERLFQQIWGRRQPAPWFGSPRPGTRRTGPSRCCYLRPHLLHLLLSQQPRFGSALPRGDVPSLRTRPAAPRRVSGLGREGAPPELGLLLPRCTQTLRRGVAGEPGFSPRSM